jgi:SAM-dependent methyltransferase
MNDCNFKGCNGKSNLIFIKNNYAIYDCSICHHRYSIIDQDKENHIKSVYSDSYFLDGKDGYPNYLNEKKILIKHGEFYARKLAKIMQPGKMFDVGAAAGFIMKGFQNNGWDCSGIEPNKSMVEYGKSKLHLNLVQGGFENYSTDDKYDLVTVIQVIGHFYDLNKALQNISDFTKNEGFVLIECWDRNSLVAKLFGKNWHEYSPPSVIHWFTRKTLTRNMGAYGFELVKSGRPLKKISMKHALSLIAGKFKIFKKPYAIFEKLLGEKDIFLIYPPLDVFYAIYQKKTA